MVMQHRAGESLPATYILPLRAAEPASAELDTYLANLGEIVEVIVVDGSAPAVFAAHAARWRGICHHLPVDRDLLSANGKVGGVLTGLRRAVNQCIVIADDDVRYRRAELERIITLLDDAEVVRPQNVFSPWPWHARWDAARSLINRAFEGDWPGTLAIRRDALCATGGYRGDVLFENLELVRTLRASGGREVVARDLFVRRHPPTTRQFLNQRVRQAYDEWARPPRLLLSLAIGPLTLLALRRQTWEPLVTGAGFAMALAEFGRRRAGGTAAFPSTVPLFAPLWVSERAVCVWAAVVLRACGGMPYAGSRLRDAATPSRDLQRRCDPDFLSARGERAPGANGASGRGAAGGSDSMTPSLANAGRTTGQGSRW